MWEEHRKPFNPVRLLQVLGSLVSHNDYSLSVLQPMIRCCRLLLAVLNWVHGLSIGLHNYKICKPHCQRENLTAFIWQLRHCLPERCKMLSYNMSVFLTVAAFRWPVRCCVNSTTTITSSVETVHSQMEPSTSLTLSIGMNYKLCRFLEYEGILTEMSIFFNTVYYSSTIELKK